MEFDAQINSFSRIKQSAINSMAENFFGPLVPLFLNN